MSKYSIEVELFKGDDPIDLPEDTDGDNFDSAIFGAKLALDKGLADKAVIYIARNNELLEIITESKESFEPKNIAVKIEGIKEHYGN